MGAGPLMEACDSSSDSPQAAVEIAQILHQVSEALGPEALSAVRKLVAHLAVEGSGPGSVGPGSGSGSGYMHGPGSPLSDHVGGMYEWEMVQAGLLLGLSEDTWGVRPCSNFECTRLEGPYEMTVKTLACEGGCGARYCCQQCQEQAWRGGHRQNCVVMREMRVTFETDLKV